MGADGWWISSTPWRRRLYHAHMLCMGNRNGWWISSMPWRKAVSVWEVRQEHSPWPFIFATYIWWLWFLCHHRWFSFLAKHQVALVLSPWKLSAPHFCFPLRYRNQRPPLALLCSMYSIQFGAGLPKSGCLLYTPATTSSVLHGRAPRVSGIRQLKG